ncbi:hypothetical protein DFJ73DRAFT_488120 [Zopfochytrium polystomum]|nr:hypothetical protein DFJ73DRAFT_488120 [Zopfochytrium polystomum]
MIVAAAVGVISIWVTHKVLGSGPHHSDRMDSKAAAAASDNAPSGYKRKSGPRRSSRLCWVIANPIWLILLVVSIILDLYSYFSLFVFIGAGTWNRPFGYSPSFFLYSSAFALVQPKPYTKLFSPARRHSSDTSFADLIRFGFNLFLVALAFCFAIKKATLTGNTSFTGVRTVVQFNGSYQYGEDSDALFVQPNYLYNHVSVVGDDNKETDLFQGPLFACGDYAEPPVSNSTFNATSTTTLICQIRQPDFAMFLDFWAVFKFLALGAAVGGYFESIQGHSPLMMYLNIPMLALTLVELLAVFGRSAASPPVYLELAWCPSTDFHFCQIMELGVLYPYSLRQTSLWATTLGAYPVEKLAGYGAISA